MLKIGSNKIRIFKFMIFDLGFSFTEPGCATIRI